MHRVLPVLLLAACGAPTDEPQDVLIQFAGAFGDDAIACDTSFDAPTGSATVEILDLRFYVSNLALVTDDGTEVPVALTADGQWQSEEVALIDLEDGSGGCSATGNSAERTVVEGTVPAGTYTGIAFDLGVPFEGNHSDSATATAPLDVSTLFWSWQGGRKFMRLDMQNDQEAPNDKWFFHLGSIGCVADGATASPEVECSRPNRPRITLSDFDASTDTITLDVEALLDGVDIGADTPETPTGCVSNPLDTAECPSIFDNLGMSFETGGCVNGCDDQIAFEVR